MDLVIDTHELDALAARFAGSGAVIERQMGQAMTETAIAVQSRARELAPVDTGRLRNSIQYEVRPDAAVIRAGSDGVTYAATMEYGRTPGSAMPPAGSLLGWMKRHGIDEGLEYVVRRAIARRGIAGRQYMQLALQDTRDSIERYFALAVERAARELGG